MPRAEIFRRTSRSGQKSNTAILSEPSIFVAPDFGATGITAASRRTCIASFMSAGLRVPHVCATFADVGCHEPKEVGP